MGLTNLEFISVLGFSVLVGVLTLALHFSDKPRAHIHRMIEGMAYVAMLVFSAIVLINLGLLVFATYEEGFIFFFGLMIEGEKLNLAVVGLIGLFFFLVFAGFFLNFLFPEHEKSSEQPLL